MSDTFAIAAPRVFDGEIFHDRAAVIVDADLVAALVPEPDLPEGINVSKLPEGVLAPGFVDLQVNGGGGVLFNDHPDVAAIRTICAAHMRLGTTGLLVTLVTDTAQNTAAAVAAAVASQNAKVPGFLGLHLEGPHIGSKRHDVHDPGLIRKMADADLEGLLAAKSRLHVLMVTVAPEAVTSAQIKSLADAGVIVSLGHSDATFAEARAAAHAGASAITHMFNAASPLAHRAPGLVGAGLETGALSASLIADGHHIAPEAIAIAARAKRGPGRLFAVSDAMPTVGSEITRFSIQGRNVTLTAGRLSFADGTLAGAHLSMAGAVRFLRDSAGIEEAEALRMATRTPVEVAGVSGRVGTLRPGRRADMVHLSAGLEVLSVWSGGAPV